MTKKKKLWKFFSMFERTLIYKEIKQQESSLILFTRSFAL